MPLTDTEVRAAKPKEKPYKLSDGGWLYLFVTTTGSKLWRISYRYEGKEKTLSFGAYPEVSLKDARNRRDEAKALLDKGIDPNEKKRIDKLTSATKSANTFALLAEEYLAKQVRDGRAETTLTRNRSHLKHALPMLGRRPVSEITTAEVLAVVRKIEARDTLDTAGRVRTIIGSVIRYAIMTGRAENDPTTALKGALATAKVKHRAAITDPISLGGLLRAIEGYQGEMSTYAAMKLLPIVFSRPGELRLAQWSEFDFDKAVCTIPAHRMKMRREHHVPLPRQAIAILKELQVETGDSKLLFPCTRSKLRPMSDNTINAAFRRMGYTKDEVTAHGFRATASTLLNESGKFSPDAIERALAHQDPDAIRRAYARGAYWAERVAMAQWWADHLDTLRKGGDVIPLTRHKH